MSSTSLQAHEINRIKALRKYNILDTPAEGNFDRITRLAASLFNVPIAIISLVDTNRIWFKSHHGLPVHQIGREPGLCASAILSNEVYIVKDALEDARTLANPLVAGDLGLRFYAAAPLQTEEHFNLGTLCIIDKTPRTFTVADKEILQQLAAIVMNEMDMRLAIRETVGAIKNLSDDLAAQLKDTIGIMEGAGTKKESETLSAYLEASRMFLLNINNRLDNL